MQAADDKVSQQALEELNDGKECRFDEKKDGPRLQPILFGSYRCKGSETNYHSMVGEAATGRKAIGKLRRYLWGAHFYWIVDCKALEAIADYHGDNRLLSRWAQELLGYAFTIVHRPASMMIDVNDLSRYEGVHPLVARYEQIAAVYAAKSRESHAWAYADVDIGDINQSRTDRAHQKEEASAGNGASSRGDDKGRHHCHGWTPDDANPVHYDAARDEESSGSGCDPGRRRCAEPGAVVAYRR